ncbi:MAG TPA: nuclear transport factor 2 family protein [Rhizomicrobium sp.]|jgi:hypothetical protein|nr:nuclear transport factor 2 family protein [Rhizomicrobium sp.]
MKLSKLALVALCAVLPGHAAFADASCARPDLEKFIRNSEGDFAKSFASRDTAVLKRILADDFAIVLDHYYLRKDSFIDYIESGTGKFEESSLNFTEVRLFGDSAVSQGASGWMRDENGTPAGGQFSWIDAWVCRDGNWQIAAAQFFTSVGDRP